jgi:hypothetical protein
MEPLLLIYVEIGVLAIPVGTTIMDFQQNSGSSFFGWNHYFGFLAE